MKQNKPICVLDLETNSKDAATAETVQFAAKKILDDKEIGRLTFICKPSHPIPLEASEVNGIYDKDVENEPPFKNFAQQIVDFVNGCVVAGYNVGYDLRILDRELEQAGHAGIFNNTIVYDAFEIFKQEAGRKLTDAYRHYIGEELVDAHDAMVDVEATWKIIEKQLKRKDKDIETVAGESFTKPDERVGFGREILIQNGIPILNIGKGKGTELAKTDKGFLKWMLNQNFSKTVKEYVRKFI